ncbi:F-box protein At5g07610-like [Ziziphus jujuba]|uniref:F-box protein At5g07610-like n=1 Tax=Ziziphus jujuba TaxID=326968 RepID=A0ABM4AFL7_ZIZJJ|nr:F-box protein At5g07610-like [Ziziphus jujuba]XP_060675507.1 F-box protein At5g07610-like [Ziziphus jujuba]
MASPNYEAQTQSLSAESVAKNDHLLIEILLRLPTNSLLTFKSVSKYWLSLISSPYFCHRHTTLCNLASGLFLPRNPSDKTNLEFPFINLNRSSQISHPPPFRTLSFINDPSGITILQSCNGLLLCCNFGLDSRNNYYVCNPTTKHYTTLPPLPVNNEAAASTCKTGFSLAFDPSKSPHYKVVCVVNTDSMGQVEIYSSETGSWRLCTVSFPSDLLGYDFHFDGGIFWNGSLHWISIWDSVTAWGTRCALYFNVDEERMSEMPLPPVPEDWEWDDSCLDYFGESGGHLHLIGYEPSYTNFNVYEIERDYSSWFLKFHVVLGEVLIAFPQMIPSLHDFDMFDFSVVCVIRCELEEPYLVMQIKGVLIVYYLKTKTFKKLCDIDHRDPDADGTLAYQYIESLACI